jgi:hypothetical protein
MSVGTHLEPWSLPPGDLDADTSAAWPDSVFANPIKRRGPLVNPRFISFVIRCFPVFADNDDEREIVYGRLIEATRNFGIPLTARSWSELIAQKEQNVRDSD